MMAPAAADTRMTTAWDMEYLAKITLISTADEFCIANIAINTEKTSNIINLTIISYTT